jgi:dCTP deaminase
MYDVDLRDPWIIEPNATYLIKLMETLRLPPEFRARANSRSSTGRVDVFTRVVVDGYPQFDEIPPGYAGPLYLEVFSRAHLLTLERGMSLNQIRFFSGQAVCSDDEIRMLHETTRLVFDEDGTPVRSPHISDGLFLHVALANKESDFVGFRVKTNTSSVLDLARRNSYDPIGFWEPVFAEPNGRLILEPGGFYLLFSREKVRIPPSVAAEMVAYEPSFGELRAHYAGFFDPGFGYGQGGEIAGTRAVLEVRCHDVPFALEDGQPICRLRFERLTSAPDAVYGSDLGSAYQQQESALSKCFKPFPKRLIDVLSRRRWRAEGSAEQLSLFEHDARNKRSRRAGKRGAQGGAAPQLGPSVS